MTDELAETIDVLEKLDDPICPICDCDISQLIGVLGNLVHFRCASCGMDFSMEIPND